MDNDNASSNTNEPDDLPSWGDSYAEKSEDFGSPTPASVPFAKKERRYSGMEIPFGVIESGSNVNELNPMIRGNSLRMAMLPAEIQHDDISFGVSDRPSTVGDFNPMRKNSGKFGILKSPPKPYANDEIPFGVEENVRGMNEVNPMRSSGKYKKTHSNTNLSSSEKEPTKEDDGLKHVGTVELVEDFIWSIRTSLLFIYVLYEIVYELGMDAIKQSDAKR